MSFCKEKPDEESKINILNAVRLGDGYLVRLRTVNNSNGTNEARDVFGFVLVYYYIHTGENLLK